MNVPHKLSHAGLHAEWWLSRNSFGKLTLRMICGGVERLSCEMRPELRREPYTKWIAEAEAIARDRLQQIANEARHTS